MLKMKNSEKIRKIISYRNVAFVLGFLFVISLLPIAYCSFFDYASGDDLWEGAAAYRVLVNNGTPTEFFRAIARWAKIDYNGWEGNWASIILWCLEPSIWGEKVYCITPWIALLAICGGTAFFLVHYLKKYFTEDSVFLAITVLAACFFIIQYMPNVKNGLFWYTGMVNYMVPYGLCLAAFVWIDKYIDSGRARYCVFASLVFAYLGGAGYITVVLAFEILALIILLNIWKNKRNGICRSLWLFVPLVLLIIGFIFSAISPGNAVRGGEDYYFSIGRVFLTILESIKQGLFGGIKHFINVRPLFMLVLFLVIVAWEKIDVIDAGLQFEHPIVVTIFLFLISCSVYAPEIYARSEVSGGVPDTIYFVFVLSLIFGILYVTCFFKKKMLAKGKKVNTEKTIKIRAGIVLGELLLCLIAGKFLIKNMSAHICMDFIQSGQLEDFEYQMQERLKILHDPEITNVILPEMNDQQGPFMHMALLRNPEAYTNRATARFYGKESVIAIPRTEYYELYGYPEGKEP